jgi:hypothetical protein
MEEASESKRNTRALKMLFLKFGCNFFAVACKKIAVACTVRENCLFMARGISRGLIAKGSASSKPLFSPLRFA